MLIRLIPVVLLFGCASFGVEESETGCHVSGGAITGDFITEAKTANDACVLFDYESDKCRIHIASSACPQGE